MVKYLYLGLIWAALVFQGCATMEKEECQTANWQQIGFEDALRGYAPDRISSHRKACAEFGITPDYNAYAQGRISGLAQYCTPAKGFSLGHSGNSYSDICSPLPNLETAFHQGFLAGRDLFLLEKEIRQREYSMRRLREELSDLESRVREKQGQLHKNCGSKAPCQDALNHIRDLDRQIHRTKDQIHREHRAIDELSDILRDRQATSPY